MNTRPKVAVKKAQGIPPFRADWDDSDIQPIQEALRELIDGLGGIESFVKPGNRVLLKPNLVAAEPPETANCTDPRVIEALIRLCKQAGASKVVVGDHPMGDVVPISGMARAAARAGAEAVNLYEGEYTRREFPSMKVLKIADVPKVYDAVDCVINVPKMKTHHTTVVTLGMKNMMGLLPFPNWVKCHQDNLYQAIVDVNLLFKPTLIVIDGLIAQEGHAPMYGFPVPDMNTLVAGVDPVPTDVVAARIMGVDTIQAPVIRVARQQNVGVTELHKIDIVGDKIEAVERAFLRGIPDLVGYSRWDGLTYPFELYAGGVCVSGCYCMMREAIDMLTVWCANKQVPDERKKKLIMIAGANAVVPEKLPDDAAVFVIGDCAKEHKDRGIFCGGCLCDAGTLYSRIGPECIGEPVDHPFHSATRQHLEAYLERCR